MSQNYRLMTAVQDLFDLYNRIGPLGPFRMSLFHNQGTAAAKAMPENLRPHAMLADQQIRGVSCLLANNLYIAALPLVDSLWRTVRSFCADCRTERAEPGYFSFITRDVGEALNMPEQIADQPASTELQRITYRLFGEILAVYLEQICGLNEVYEEHRVLVTKLRFSMVERGAQTGKPESD